MIPAETTARDRCNKKCLLRLKDNGLIERLKVFHTHKVSGHIYQDAVNILTREGARQVAEFYAEDGTGQQLRWRPELKRFANQTIDHELAVNDFAIAAHRACWERHWDLFDWHDDDRLSRRPTALGNLLPDGFGVIAASPRLIPIFVEIDRGTETVHSDRGSATDWKSRVERYGAYLAQRFATDPLLQTLGYAADELTPPLVLIATTSRPRLDHMRAATHAAGGDARFWYTTNQALYRTPDAFWTPIWWSATSPHPLSLADYVAFGVTLSPPP